jgi:site-specific recombinase XerD
MITVKLTTLEQTKQGYPVYLYININGRRLHFFTDVYITNSGNIKEGKIGKGEGNYLEKNLRLTKILADTTALVYQHQDTNILKQQIPVILGHVKQADKLLLIDQITHFASLKLHDRTRRLYEGTVSKVKAFTPDITVDNVDKQWLIMFEQYCAKTMSINGYAIHMRNIRAVFNHLIDEGIITTYPFRTYKIKKEQTVHRVLTDGQLSMIKHASNPEYALEYRDLFMLSLYLIGINIKDLLYITPDQVHNGRLVYHRFKTNRLYDINIEPEAFEILQKYQGRKYLLNCMDRYKDYLNYLHHINHGLKKLGMEYTNGKGYDKNTKPICPNLSTYYARHTWATLAYGLGISKDVISQALGHSNGVSVTDIYIEYDRDKVDEANRKVIDYINGL